MLCVITLLCIHHVSAWHSMPLLLMDSHLIDIEHATIAQIAKNYAQKLSYVSPFRFCLIGRRRWFRLLNISDQSIL